MALDEEQLQDRWRVPTRQEMRELLESYMVGPVGDETVDIVESRLLAARDDLGACASYTSHFQSMTRWRGMAWYEDNEFTSNRRQMTPRHLVVMVANMLAERDRESAPRPKLYCPTMFVGEWGQVEPPSELPGACVWKFAADGAFCTDDPDVRAN